MVRGGPRLFDVEKMAQLLDNPRFERAALVTVQAVRRAKVRYVFLHQYFGHCVALHVIERECSCSLGKVVRQDVHSHSLQRITRSQGCISARFLTAFFLPHTACTCGTISVRPHSSRASRISFWS
ncbi:hypothetical protein T12_1883 [Trichinella patagoniensis]|uniref:Uncharacterized protein n=1 Tax=Trichinella patagoniensis TaxID=990121 RepID=A0A0V0ZTL2_9BILA|nr:hypothetical protein T12_1883 [Trichinella patagoniensis]